MDKYISYAQSGVSIDANDQMVDRIYSSLTSTFGPRVIEARNGFAGMFRLDYDERLFKKNYKNPVLVACTDGVGSKVQLAVMARKFDTVGIDLVAMSVNDMLVVGAEPLFFLDYLGVHQLEPAFVGALVQGIASGCKIAECALIGGETAEMPDTYTKGDFDMAGFAVGVVEKNRIIDGQRVQPGDIVLGLASSGLHSNGYTLARTICFKRCQLALEEYPDELEGMTVQEALLQPTRIYVRSIIRLLSGYKVKRVVHAMAHITGGGLVGNLPRVLPDQCNAVIDPSTWPVPQVFSFLQTRGPVATEEMYRVFNMGIGFVLVVAPDFADSITSKLSRLGETVYRIGTITRGNRKVVFK
jgi:phosphoribosylformylglycinamidine cyclo-ligase